MGKRGGIGGREGEAFFNMLWPLAFLLSVSFDKLERWRLLSFRFVFHFLKGLCTFEER